MNDFWLFLGSLVAVTLIAAVWCVMKELFTRWLNNDWCRHNWDMWSGVDKESNYQYRFCRKCNRGERRIP
jgi:hypothetical protein